MALGRPPWHGHGMDPTGCCLTRATVAAVVRDDSRQYFCGWSPSTATTYATTTTSAQAPSTGGERPLGSICPRAGSSNQCRWGNSHLAAGALLSTWASTACGLLCSCPYLRATVDAYCFAAPAQAAASCTDGAAAGRASVGRPSFQGVGRCVHWGISELHHGGALSSTTHK